MHILTWHQQGHWTTRRSMSHVSETLTSGTEATAEANTTTWATLATTRSWLHDVWWKWIFVIIDYYSNMPIVWKMPTSQCNSAKMITILKELFAEHGIPEEIRSDNGPQFASHLFVEFTKDWNIKHSTSSPWNPRSNGQAESAVKIGKDLLTHIKCFGQDPYLTLSAYRSTPVDTHLWSAEMLYQCALCTTVPQRIRHKDPHAAAEHERLEECATQSAVNHDNPSPLHQPQQLYRKHSLLPQYNHLSSVAPATPKQAVAWSPKAAAHIQQKTPATADVQSLTDRTDVTPHRSCHVSKAPQCLIEQM